MAAFTGTPTGSALYNKQVGTTVGKPSAHLAEGQMRISRFTYTHAAGAGTGEVNLFVLPPGYVSVYSYLSHLFTSAFVATADLHLGYRAYTDSDGSAVVADDNAFLDNADVGGGALDITWLLPTGYVKELDSMSGVTVYAMVDTANIEDADTLDGWCVWASIG